MLKANDYIWAYVGDGHWVIGNPDGSYKVPDEYSEQVILVGGPKSQDLTNQIVNIKPGLTYLSFPTGEFEDESKVGSFYYSSKQIYGSFKGLYFNPSPFGLSMHNLPSAGTASKPAYENGKRVMFWETMTLQDSYWEWEARGNSLATNNAWKPGENCVF